MNPDQVSSAFGFVQGCTSNKSHLSEPARKPLQTELMDTELRFYSSYPWCLNIFPTIEEVVQHLRHELSRLDQMDEDWQYAEVMTNVFLLSCAITDTVDDYLLGKQYDFSPITTVLPWIGPAIRTVEKLLNVSRRVRELHHRRVREWRENWAVGVVRFLRALVAAETPSRIALSDARV